MMVRTAAAIYGGAAFVGVLEELLPGGPSIAIEPGIASLVLVIALLALGTRIPTPALVALGPIGVALIGYALATTQGAGDAAVLYMWPVLWAAYFFGRTGSALIVAWVGVVHALALIALPAGVGNLDRWLDVMVSVSVVAAVVYALSQNNRRLLARLAVEARVDQLTGVLNRRGFEERLQVELDRVRRDEAPMGVVSFDIDHFKRVNDDFGHEVGDQVLAHLGAVLAAKTRTTDVVARTGGEEFVALLPGTGAAGSRAYAERVRAAFAARSGLDLPNVTVSAGVTAEVAPEDAGALLQRSDSALYAAKRAGRDRTVVAGELAGGRSAGSLTFR
jgi:diguanylate cyclase (GGDEF)-like protein